MSQSTDGQHNESEELISREYAATVFDSGRGEPLVTADGLREVLDAGGCSWIVTGDRVPGRYLGGDDLREASDSDGRTWVVSVADGRVVAGFLVEASMAEGDVVICLAEEEGLHSCPGSLCRDPRQICRNRPADWHERAR